MSNYRNPWVLAGLVLLSWGQAHGAVITLKIRVINPSKTENQKATVNSALPGQVKPEDVVNAGGLDVVYDVDTKSYAVKKEVELKPSESRIFEVVIKDIWTIPEADIQTLKTHAGKLAEALKSSNKEESAGRLKDLIDTGVKTVLARQAAYEVGAVKPLEHIRAYEANSEAVTRIRTDVGILENLVIASGKDPEVILGAPKIPPRLDRDMNDATNAVIVLHIKISNSSLTEKRKVPLKHDFPAEVRPTDILDAGGLQIGVDSTKNLCYAYLLEDIELEPQGTKVFDVKIRDPWATGGGKLPKLEARVKEILNITREMDSYKAVIAQAQVILKDLDEVKARKSPEGVNDQYVAFARRQATDIHEIETRIQRLEELFQPSEKPMKGGVPMMDVPRPDKRTTWVIIYIILGFLGVFSLLFYLRWYGKGKAEKVEGMGQKSEDRGQKTE
ncbi:MAG: hypothetical protein WCO42_09740 [bacterium]